MPSFEDYQKNACSTLVHPRGESREVLLARLVLGLCGESGEVAEKFKKVLRDDGGVISVDKRVEIAKELGDVLWYLAVLASEIGLKLEEVAVGNAVKLSSRQSRDQIKGSGDNR